MNFLKERLSQLGESLRAADWKNILVLFFFLTGCILSWAWVDAELRSSMARVEYAEKIKNYAGKLEEENKAVREMLLESQSNPDVWGLKLISEIIMPRVNFSADGLPQGKEKVACVTVDKMLQSFGITLLNDENAAQLSPQQKAFILKLITAEMKYFNRICKKYI